MGIGSARSKMGVRVFSSALIPSAATQSAQTLAAEASGAKAPHKKKGIIAALKALRHPKFEFFSKL